MEINKGEINMIRPEFHEENKEFFENTIMLNDPSYCIKPNWPVHYEIAYVIREIYGLDTEVIPYDKCKGPYIKICGLEEKFFIWIDKDDTVLKVMNQIENQLKEIRDQMENQSNHNTNPSPFTLYKIEYCDYCIESPLYEDRGSDCDMTDDDIIRCIKVKEYINK